MDANTPEVTVDLARLLSLYRAEHDGISQHKVAAELSRIAGRPISQAAVSRWENGGLVDGAWRRQALGVLLDLNDDDAERVGRGGIVTAPPWARRKVIDDALNRTVVERKSGTITDDVAEQAVQSALVEITRELTKRGLDVHPGGSPVPVDLVITDEDGTTVALIEVKSTTTARTASDQMAGYRVHADGSGLEDAAVVMFIAGEDAEGEAGEIYDPQVWHRMTVAANIDEVEKAARGARPE